MSLFVDVKCERLKICIWVCDTWPFWRRKKIEMSVGRGECLLLHTCKADYVSTALVAKVLLLLLSAYFVLFVMSWQDYGRSPQCNLRVWGCEGVRVYVICDIRKNTQWYRDRHLPGGLTDWPGSIRASTINTEMRMTSQSEEPGSRLISPIRYSSDTNNLIIKGRGSCVSFVALVCF